MPDAEPVQKIVRPLRGGQITIPVEFRKELGITENSLLRVTLDQGELHIKPVNVASEEQGSPWLRELYELFAPTRQDILHRGISQEELHADIDASIEAVRAEELAKR